MRLLEVLDSVNWSITPDLPVAPAPYAILSHTWGADEDEVTFKDVQERSGIHKSGVSKLQFCASQARKDGLHYFWIDTCCIDKANQVELSEAITSMFRWYNQAEKCYVYLSDVSTESDDGENAKEQWEQAFRNSRWFKRGWTLQELLAPTNVEFFSREQKRLGSKKTLESLIHEITRIPLNALQGQSLSHFTVDERLRWTRGRHTRKVEDRAYCLLGIFGVSMSLRYGEGEKALARLEKKAKRVLKSTENPEFINWLAPSRSRELHAKASRSRHSGTGLRFIEETLKPWLTSNSASGRFMCITGKSGMGKTTLFSHVTDTIETFSSDNPNTAFAYHYCTFSEPNSQKLVNLLGSFVVQLSARQPSILEWLMPVFAKDQERKQVKTLQVWELEQALIKFGARLSTTILLIDALNESEDFFETCACIERLFQQMPDLKVLATSNRYVSVSSTSQVVRVNHIQMDPLGDIQSFVDYNLNHDITLCCLSTDCKNAIRGKLLGQADQSFRWISLILGGLSRERSEEAVLAALTNVPRGLHDIYARMIAAIPSMDRTIAREVLIWVCFAVRPMTLRELSEAAILGNCEGNITPQMRLIRPEIILEICQSFLDYDNSSGKVKLAHSSVRDYLLSEQDRDEFFRFDEAEGHRFLMKRCLTYLMLENFRTGAYWKGDSGHIFRLHREFPLLQYAAYYWGVHAQDANSSEWNMANQFFSTRSLHNGGNYAVWGSCLMPAWDFQTVVKTEPLYYAASLELVPLLRALLSQDPDSVFGVVNIEKSGGRFGSTALQVACFRARKRAAKSLVAADANFWSNDPGTGKPAWYWARFNGWSGVLHDMAKRNPGIKPLVHYLRTGHSLG